MSAKFGKLCATNSLERDQSLALPLTCAAAFMLQTPYAAARSSSWLIILLMSHLGQCKCHSQLIKTTASPNKLCWKVIYDITKCEQVHVKHKLHVNFLIEIIVHIYHHNHESTYQCAH